MFDAIYPDIDNPKAMYGIEEVIEYEKDGRVLVRNEFGEQTSLDKSEIVFE